MLAHGIDMVFHGHEEHETIYEEMYSVPIKLGKFTRTQRKAGISTSALLDRVALSTKDKADCFDVCSFVLGAFFGISCLATVRLYK